MSYRLLLVDAQGHATCRPLRLRELRRFPGEGLSVHFRPVRNDVLFESAKAAGRLAYRILFGEGVVRSQLWVEYELPGEHVNVTGRSSDLLFALALTRAAWARAGDTNSVIAATGVVDVDGSVLSVERPAQKVAAAVRDLGSADVPAVVFYPSADAPAVEEWRRTSTVPSHIELRAVECVEDALAHLGCALEKVYLRNPFRGLEHFDYGHHAIFFGRDSEIREFVEQLLRREAAGTPGLLVEGTSGSGKSSFLRAGILPTLVNPRHQPQSVQAAIGAKPVSVQVRQAIWRPGLMTPRSDEAGIARSIAECWSAFSEISSDGEVIGAQTLETLAQLRRDRWPPSSRFVWVIDQLEEILTLGLEDFRLEALGQFLAQLQKDGVWTLACVRSDALPTLKRRESLRCVFGSNEGLFYLATLSGLALDDVITRPARAADLTFGLDADGKSLDQRLREEAYREQDSLPLLQFTLNELYVRRSGRELTYAAYQDLGGLSGSIATTAEAILQVEAADSARHLPRLFRSLVSVDETGRATRRYVPWVEIESLPTQANLVRRLVAARLCVTDQREGESVVAFAHDSLLRTLPALIDWLREEAGLLQTRELAQREARLWQQHDESDAWLAGADKLVAFKALEATDIVLSPSVQTFIGRSERQVRRLSRIKQTAVALIALLAVAASVGAWVATQKQREAEYQTAQARRAQLQLLTEAAAERLKDGDLVFARGIILEVLRRRAGADPPDPAAMNVFQEIRASDPALAIMSGHTRAVIAVAYSPDGKRIVTGSMDGTARVWDARTGIQVLVLAGHNRTVRTAVYSPDGTRVLTASSDRTARVWDAQSGRPIFTLSDSQGCWFAAYSPDGTRIVTTSQKGIRIWDAHSGAPISSFTGPGGSFGIVAYSPDATRIVTTSDDLTARVWDARTGAQLLVLSGHRADLSAASFSPDGQRILTASFDTSARIWDARSGAQLMILKEHVGQVRDALYSPDGSRIATTGTDKTARLWDAATGKQLRVLSGHVNILGAAAFSPDGTHLVTGSWDLTARTWHLNAGPEPILLAHGDQVGSVAYSPDGTRLLTSCLDNKVRIWDARNGRLLGSLAGHTEGVNSAVYSPDGTRILTASDDRSVRVWDVQTGTELLAIPGTDEVMSAQYSPDGTRIVAAFANLTFGTRDARTGAPVVAYREGHRDYIPTAVYSPDGSNILTASIDKSARIWDAQTLAQLVIFPHKDFVNSAAYSPDGRRIVTASNDSNATLWDAKTGEQIGTLSGHHAYVFRAEYSRDGHRIVTGSKDNTVRIWDADSGIQLDVLLGHTDRIVGVAYSPDGSHVASASFDRTARIWDARVPADWQSQLLWEQAVEADDLSDVQRTQLGFPSTMAQLTNTVLDAGTASARHEAPAAIAASACNRQAAAIYDPERGAPGVDLASINADIATLACARLAAARDASAKVIYQMGRARMAAGDFQEARRNFELAVRRGYRAARVDLAQLLTDPSAGMLDPTRAVALYQQAWRSGISYAGFALAALYEQGIEVNKADRPAVMSADSAKAWSWYAAAAARHEPNALAQFAQREERSALEEAPAKADAHLLEAFRLYALAADYARSHGWPNSAWISWRYRRSTLARMLAEDEQMQNVADVFKHVLSTQSQ